MDLTGKTILVTGGTGSFGTRFIETRAAQSTSPQSVRVFSRDELKQSELQRRFADDDAAALPPRRRARPARDSPAPPAAST